MLVSFLVVALLQPCPGSSDVADVEVFKLPAECSAPRTVWAYTLPAYADNAAELAGLDVLVTTARAERDKCRVGRKKLSGDCERYMRADADLISRLTDEVAAQPSRAAWFFIGAGAAAAVLGGIWALVERSK